MTAIHLVWAEDGTVNERIKEFYFARADGGVAMAIVGGVASDRYVGYKSMLRLDSDRYIQGFAELADGMHDRGAKLGVQLLQTGRYGQARYVEGDSQIVSASAVGSKMSGDTPRAMTIAEIREVQRSAAAAAARAVQAGADCVELTAGSGYLISQFLSPVTNLRTDQYGGSWENRSRFGREMVQEVRDAIGDAIVLSVRVAGNEFMPGGNGVQECVDFTLQVEAAGANLIDVTGGWHETHIPQLPGDVPRGGFVYLAKAVKDAVAIPVLSANRHNDPIEAERVLALGQADIIGQCRTQLADPDWVNKVQTGKFDSIRKCVACNQGCLANVFSERPARCLLNPEVGREWVKDTQAHRGRQRILVVGAGVAGCEFAQRAAVKGHDVTVWEKSDQIGGKLPLVAAPRSKREFSDVPTYYRTALDESGVNVVVNREGTAGAVAQGGFDSVVVATGAVPKSLALPGSARIPVYTPDDILSQRVMAGKDVVIVGGGSVGCETAEYLAEEGSLSADKLHFLMSQQAESAQTIDRLLNTSDRHIALVDIARIGANFDYGCGWPVIKDLRRLGVKQFPSAEVVQVHDDSVDLKYTDPKTGKVEAVRILCDTLIVAVGYAPDNALFQELKNSGIDAAVLGDCDVPGRAIDAINQAYELALGY